MELHETIAVNNRPAHPGPSMTGLWNRILEEFARLDPHLTRAWFNDLRPTSLSNGTLHILTSNPAQTRYLHERCLRGLTVATQTITGRLISIRLEELAANEACKDGVPDPPASAPLPNPRYTFDSLIEGPCNRLARSAALAVAQEPGVQYNPLFIFGESASGKTHLLHALLHALSEKSGSESSCHLSADAFTHRLIRAMEKGRLSELQASLGRIGALLLDDFHKLAGRTRSRQELFACVDLLLQNQRPVVVASRLSLDEIVDFEPRLVTRFQAGLAVRMERPCTETLRAIIQARAGLLGLELGADVLPLLAEEIHRSPRSLDDLFGRLSALGSRRQGAITVNAVHETLLRRKTGLVSLERIVEVVSRRLGPFSLAAGDPSGSASHAYRVAVYLAQHLTDRSVEEIARFFGISEPLIVRRLIRMAARRLETDLTLRVLMADLSEEARTLGD